MNGLQGNHCSEGLVATSLWNPDVVETQTGHPDLVEIDLQELSDTEERNTDQDCREGHSRLPCPSDGSDNSDPGDNPSYRSPLSFYLEKMFYIGICPYNPNCEMRNPLCHKIQKVKGIC